MKKPIFLLFVSVFLFSACTVANNTNISPENISNRDKVSNQNELKATGKWADIKIVTENYPPLNYIDKEDGLLKGQSTEMVREAMDNLDIDIPIKVYPWARTYQTALEEENVLIYSIARTEDREDLFRWIAPVAVRKVNLYALKESDIKINKLADIRNYTVSTMKEDFTEQELKKRGYGDVLLSSPNQIISVTQLFKGRSDLWIATARKESLDEICKQAGHDKEKLEPVFEVKDMEAHLYLAASLKTSDEIVNEFREAMPPVLE